MSMNKGLEALRDFQYEYSMDGSINLEYLDIAETELKVLELILNKNVNIKWLKITKNRDFDLALQLINSYASEKDKLTKEELELLRSVL